MLFIAFAVTIGVGVGVGVGVVITIFFLNTSIYLILGIKIT
jgi:hypothetical protein